MINEIKTRTIGELIRNLRESGGLTLKIVAEEIGTDISLLAKIERNERPPTKQLIRSVSEFFNVDENFLQNHLLSDLIAYKILEEDADLNILKVAEKKVKYFKNIKNEK